MPSAAITLTASNRLWGHHRSDQLHRPAYGAQFDLQLGDAPLGRLAAPSSLFSTLVRPG
jgi:hypothetical protein